MPASGWLNVDAYPDVGPDLIADARALPFADGSVDMLYAGHVLEHIPVAEVSAVLCEFRRVAGRVCVVGPDYDRAVARNEDPVLLDLIRHGGNRWPGDQHQWLSTCARTLQFMQAVWPDAHDVPVGELDDAWPIPFRVEWQFAIVAGDR